LVPGWPWEDLGRKALFVDIPLVLRSEDKPKKEALRFYTTHSASLKMPRRSAALHLIHVFSQLRKQPASDVRIRGGLIRGHLDFAFPYVGAWNSSAFVIWDEFDGRTSISLPYHRHYSSNLASQTRVVELIQDDTLESELELQLPPKRSHKFLAMGLLRLSELQEVKGLPKVVGRIGVGLKTRLKTCESGGLRVQYAGSEEGSTNGVLKGKNESNVLVSR
jgi:hypothetical protein